MDCWQPAGSFKIRGVGLLSRHAVAEGAERLVSSSGGNAGLAAAWAGRELGVQVMVVVPETTGPAVRNRLMRLGAEVRVHGAVWDVADALARELASQPGAAYVPPFDHPQLWRGHASLIVECADQGRKPDQVVVSVGGGGLMCGVLMGMHQVGWDDVPLIAVETEGAASLNAAIHHGGPVEIDGIHSLAKSLGALTVAEEAFEWTRRHEVRSVLVSDGEAVDACLRFARDHRTLVEPACGAALALAYGGHLDKGDTLIEVCGGAGVTLDELKRWAEATG
jgi:L-serine/L-threonine ammonia-lyase